MDKRLRTPNLNRQELQAPSLPSLTSKPKDNLQTVQSQYSTSRDKLDPQKIDLGPVLEAVSSVEKAVSKKSVLDEFYAFVIKTLLKSGNLVQAATSLEQLLKYGQVGEDFNDIQNKLLHSLKSNQTVRRRQLLRIKLNLTYWTA